MPGYRLSFGTQHVMACSIADTVEPAMDALAAAIGTLSGFAEVLGHDYLVATGSGQFIIRFEAAGDAEAYGAAKVAIDAVQAPVDGVKLERRSRRYVPVEA